MDSADEAEQAEEDENIVKVFDEVGGSRYFLSISKAGFGPLLEAMVTAYF